jgi:hypothetical protein
MPIEGVQFHPVKTSESGMPIITSVLSAIAEWPADREHPSRRTQQDPLSE